ncbi:hypothetical protein RXV86_07415 [Alisedimentitalea sp. MJ-SS2]|uniref:ImuA family protein n=1 Tax=Aliisedimentitalea sp. MJ-SS2 TaxID=3049795 RepID=UPI0029110DDA|nr:hypothetical protein [Alisedimentitalea sp. MJ-SS2]MDU8927208.1 hypothetical protein [Alisedimentitalea sp. MJ-SS2]
MTALASAPLSRRQHRTGPVLSLAPDITLPLARLHEGCGAARRSFAVWVAGRMAGPVFWIAPKWEPARLHPDGLARFAEPGRFTFITPERPIDILWCMEESLRSGLVPLVVADLPEPPGLTPVRRLHLAAETGAREGAHAPLGLILTPGSGGAAGVESRWQMEPAHEATAQGWQLRRLRARTAPIRKWRVRRGKSGFEAA